MLARLDSGGQPACGDGLGDAVYDDEGNYRREAEDQQCDDTPPPLHATTRSGGSLVERAGVVVAYCFTGHGHLFWLG